MDNYYSKWRMKRVYPILGMLTILGFLYLNFGDHLHFRLPLNVWNLPEMGFVGVNQTRFLLFQQDGTNIQQQLFYVNGWNSYWLMAESAREYRSSKVSQMLSRGADMGFTVCRTWAFSDGPGPDSLQLRPGVFDERVFQALDYVLVEARKNRIRLILSLVNNLKAYGGKDQYVRWAVEELGINVTSSDSFFSDPLIKHYYKAYVKAIITRKNSFTGIRYSEEPAIFAWELINEPRCESSSSAPALQAWITEMAAYVKSLDQKHLVTVGTEGFYGSKSTVSYDTNPGTWAASLGSDFITNSGVKDIDFASVHAYPHSWIPAAELDKKVEYLANWVDAHIQDGDNLLKKPVLFTEVGAPTTKTGGSNDRYVLLKTVYEKIYKSAEMREAGAGVLIWQLLVEGVEEYSDEFSFVAWKYPSTYNLILQQSCKLLNMSSQGLTNTKDHCFKLHQ